MKAAASRTRTSAAASAARHAKSHPEHPMLALQRQAGNRAVAGLIAQREPAKGRRGGRRKRYAHFDDPWTTLSDMWAQAIVETMQKIYDTSRYVDAKVAGYLAPYGGHLWNLYLSYRSDTAGMFPGSKRLEVYDAALAGLQPAIAKYTASEDTKAWYDDHLRDKVARGRQEVQFGIASDRVKVEVAAGRGDPKGKHAAVATAAAAADPSEALQLVDGYLAGVSKVKGVYGGEFDYKAARTRRRAGESRASSATAAEIDAVGKLDATASTLKTAKALLTLGDDAFARKLATLDAKGPLGQVRSRVEVAKVAVELVQSGTETMHTILSLRAAATGNQEALRTLNSFKKGTMGKIGHLSDGISILANALTILDNPMSKEGLEAGVGIAATLGKGTPLAKAKDIYDFGKNAVTVLNEDATRAERIDAAMGLIGVAGPLGASLKLTYSGLRALGDLYAGAAQGLVAAGVYPATTRMLLEAQGLGAGVEKLAATARLLDNEADPGQRAALQRIAEIQINSLTRDIRQMIGTASQRSDERDSYGNIRIYRELFRFLRHYRSVTDPEEIMRGAIAIMRTSKWAADHLDTVIRAETSGTSIGDAMEWEEEQRRKAEKARKEAAERKKKLDEMLKGMSPEQRKLVLALMG